jgi:hypothetical protein
MTANQLSICLLEGFDPREVEDIAFGALETDKIRLEQLLQALLGEYPVITKPRISCTVESGQFRTLLVDVHVAYNPDQTTVWGIGNFIFRKGQQLGITFRSGIGQDSWDEDKNPAHAHFKFVMVKETRMPQEGEYVLEGKSRFDPEEVKNLAHSVYGKRHWVEIYSSMYPWEQGGVWWDSVNDEMVAVRGCLDEVCQLVYKFKVQPIESYSFVDVARILYDLDLSQQEWDRKTNLAKLGTIASMYGYGDLFDPNPKQMTKPQLRKLLQGIPIP